MCRMPLRKGTIIVSGPTAGTRWPSAPSSPKALTARSMTSNGSVGSPVTSSRGARLTSPCGLSTLRPSRRSCSARSGRTRKVTSRPAWAKPGAEISAGGARARYQNAHGIGFLGATPRAEIAAARDPAQRRKRPNDATRRIASSCPAQGQAPPSVPRLPGEAPPPASSQFQCAAGEGDGRTQRRVTPIRAPTGRQDVRQDGPCRLKSQRRHHALVEVFQLIKGAGRLTRAGSARVRA